ncbi:histidine kinase [Pedobacter sp. HMWF019]|uniref:GAF domain-containing sensor histidine kinase n=1 Tax=Pedobacter sp. HMWF019 TaxID=2056856 RepID=UPI000D34E4FA|nr:GAF domain-containing sensor histidine kinase [Pedobacter sp. HMWF019]PTS98534.1 histidine kinase [Pedobacter sp. HMWF019]
MNTLSTDIQEDIQTIGRIPVISRILEVICRTTGMGFAAVARVTDTRWVACSVRDEIDFGLAPGGELELETTICHEIRQSGHGVVIDHVAQDPAFQNHHTPERYGFQSYISMPIFRKDGTFFGTLCAIDPRPARLKNSEVIEMFNLYSDLISFHLHSVDRVSFVELQLEEERKALKLREQFIAILGHDLRNPLGAVSSSAQLMLRQPLDDKMRKLAEIVKNSSFRMKELIENVLDFARAEQGSGISIHIQENEAVSEILNEVISELQAIWPNRRIEFTEDLAFPVHCDGSRIAQLFSNLLGNALSHGNENGVIKVNAVSDVDFFRLSVSNQGTPISKDRIGNLFEPYVRGEEKNGGEGLGLGLYICSEIARAHGGKLDVCSDETETCFTLTLKC